MVIPLFTCPLWNKLRSKTASWWEKQQHGFVAHSVTNRMRPSQKKKVKDTRKIVYLNSGALSLRRVKHAVTHLSSDGGRNLVIGFLDK